MIRTMSPYVSSYVVCAIMSCMILFRAIAQPGNFLGEDKNMLSGRWASTIGDVRTSTSFPLGARINTYFLSLVLHTIHIIKNYLPVHKLCTYMSQFIPSFVCCRDMCSAFFFPSLIFVVDRLSQSLVSSVSM